MWVGPCTNPTCGFHSAVGLFTMRKGRVIGSSGGGYDCMFADEDAGSYQEFEQKLGFYVYIYIFRSMFEFSRSS